MDLSQLSLSVTLDESVRDELDALAAIYEQPDSLSLDKQTGDERDRVLRLDTRLPEPYSDVPLSLLLALPNTYPSSSPPRIEISSKYLGAYAADDSLRLLVSTIFESNDLWSPGTQAVCYEGLESAREACRQWYEERLSTTAVLDDRRESEQAQAAEAREAAEKNNSADEAIGNNGEEAEEEYELDQLDWAVCEPIVDRKSVFVGHAVALSSPTQVKPFLRQLKSDKKIAKATHNIVAWRCRVAGTLHLDNDDDGETAAGGRMAHLLSILETDNVLVCCTRWYGGIQLGPDRFKHINTATRNALQAGGFLKDSQVSTSKGGGKGNKSKR